MTNHLASNHRPGRGAGLALIGYRGTGKSTVGRMLADRLDRPFLDADLEIEARAGMSISSIFTEWGEPAFRDWEERTLVELTEAFPDAILATGGGAILRPSNRALLARFGLVVWLRAEPAEMARRIEADQASGSSRPSLTAAGTIAEIAQVYHARQALYEAAADAAVDTQGKTPGEVAELVLALWQP
jgi:shikimate kinase